MGSLLFWRKPWRRKMENERIRFRIDAKGLVDEDMDIYEPNHYAILDFPLSKWNQLSLEEKELFFNELSDICRDRLTKWGQMNITIEANQTED